MGYFSELEKIPQDPVFGLVQRYKQDKRQDKIDLGIGVYYNDNLEAGILKSVKMAEVALAGVESSKVYLPIDGDLSYVESVKKLVLGEVFVKSLGKRLYGCQSLGGTSALRTSADLLKSIASEVYVSDPTWVNHAGIFQKVGFKVKTYPYYDADNKEVSFQRMLHSFEKLHEKSVIVLHACCHNPTGLDLTLDQWKLVSDVIKKRNLIPVFDLAYQGFGKGLEEDASAIKLFIEKQHELFVCVSFSKIFGLYAERVGALLFVGEDLNAAEVVASHAKKIIRVNYSNPSKHGALIVSYILNNQHLSMLWHEELTKMRQRIHQMRSDFISALSFQMKTDRYDFLRQAQGLFCYLDLSDDSVEKLREEFAIYVADRGRVNLTAMNRDNLEIVVSAMVKVIR